MSRNNGLAMARLVADFQFGGIGKSLFPDGCSVEVSPSSGRVRRVRLEGKLLATIRPGDGLISLTLEGGRILASIAPPPKYRVTVSDDAAELVACGKSVFSRHVVGCDRNIIPGQEVIVQDLSGRILAVGKSLLSGEEMGLLRRGVAVKVRDSVRVR